MYKQKAFIIKTPLRNALQIWGIRSPYHASKVNIICEPDEHRKIFDAGQDRMIRFRKILVLKQLQIKKLTLVISQNYS